MVVSEFHCATLSMLNVNGDCDVEIIISGNKPPVLLNEVFIKKIQYRTILHLSSRVHVLSPPLKSHQHLSQVPHKLLFLVLLTELKTVFIKLQITYF